MATLYSTYGAAPLNQQGAFYDRGDVMRSQNLRLALPALGAIAIAVACTLTQVGPPSDADSSCATSLSTAEFNGWFEPGAVSLNGTISGAVSLNGAVKPANSRGLS